jgi:splicing factor 3A subunit 1
MTGANMMPLRAPHPQQMMMPPQPFFMAPQPPQMMAFGNIAPPPNMHGMGPKPPMDMGEPPSKRMRGEESLIPESEFMARHHSPVTFKVVVPNMADKPGKSSWITVLFLKLHRAGIVGKKVI